MSARVLVDGPARLAAGAAGLATATTAGVATAALTRPLTGCLTPTGLAGLAVAGAGGRGGRGRTIGDRALSSQDALLTWRALLTGRPATVRTGVRLIAGRRPVRAATTRCRRGLTGSVRLVAGLGLFVPVRTPVPSGRLRASTAPVGTLSAVALLALLTWLAAVTLAAPLAGLAVAPWGSCIAPTLGDGSAVPWLVSP